MAISKINDELLSSEKRFHANLDDIPGKNASDMKNFMDYIPRQVIIPKVNEVVDEINKILPESEASGQYAYTIAQTNELLAKKADKSELEPIIESVEKKVEAEFVEQKISDSLADDYIVEKGESGYFEYEKWQSGKVVCYGKTTATFTIDKALGSAYYSNSVLVSFVNNLFKSAPDYACVTPYTTGGLYFPVVQNLTKSGFTLLLGAPYSMPEAKEYNLTVYAVGKWK